MDQHENNANRAEGRSKTDSSAYVPPLQLTEGQPPPIAANGGLSYLSFDRDGDAGTTAALEDAFAYIAKGEGQRLIEKLQNTPTGPVETKWGPGFRDYEECLEYIRANNIAAPEGGIAVPLAYTVYEQPTYSVVRSNMLWGDPAQQDKAKLLGESELNNKRYNLFFPVLMRDARRIGEYHPGLAPNSADCMDRLGVSLVHCDSKCANFYDSAEVERVFYPEIEKLLLDFWENLPKHLIWESLSNGDQQIGELLWCWVTSIMCQEGEASIGVVWGQDDISQIGERGA